MTETRSAKPAPLVEGWSREGFLGERAGVIRSNYTPDYISVSGPHAPRRLNIGDVVCADKSDPGALATPFATARSGLALSVSQRSEAMSYVIRNVEADEIHFVQTGELDFHTDYGFITAVSGDFIYIPRSVAYRVRPKSASTLSLIVESPGALRFDTPAPAGMIHFGEHVVRAKPESNSAPDAPTTLLLKCEDGITRFEKGFDPLFAQRQLAAFSPVWKLNLRHIQPVVYWPHGGPPAHFLASPNNELLLYTLSARPGNRPPIHVNADYDEMIFYFAGPDPWGNVSEPGTFTWVPKGVTHQGPPENAAIGYSAWLLESRTTLRLTPQGLAASQLMETGMYGMKRDAAD